MSQQTNEPGEVSLLDKEQRKRTQVRGSDEDTAVVTETPCLKPLTLHFSTGDNFVPQATSGNVWEHFQLSPIGGQGVLLASRGQKPGMLLHTLLCPGQPPQQIIIWPQMSVAL